jgi:hypothetical protein
MTAWRNTQDNKAKCRDQRSSCHHKADRQISRRSPYRRCQDQAIAASNTRRRPWNTRGGVCLSGEIQRARAQGSCLREICRGPRHHNRRRQAFRGVVDTIYAGTPQNDLRLKKTVAHHLAKGGMACTMSSGRHSRQITSSRITSFVRNGILRSIWPRGQSRRMDISTIHCLRVLNDVHGRMMSSSETPDRTTHTLRSQTHTTTTSRACQ